MHWEVLSVREMTTLELGSVGLRDQEIADKMEVSVTSIRTYWARLRVKLGKVTRREAICAFKKHVNNDDQAELENYRAMSKYAALGMVHPDDKKWVVKLCSNSFANLLNRRRHDLMEKDLFSILPVEQRPAVKKLFGIAREHGYAVSDLPFGSDAHGVTMVTQCEWPIKNCLRIFHSPKIRVATHAVVGTQPKPATTRN